MSEVEQLFDGVKATKVQAGEDLIPLIYQELRRLAAWHMANERPGQTLQPTALVHEAWLRLQGNESQPWNGRRHFFASAAEAMRRVLIDRARQKKALRHGGGLHRTDTSLTDLPMAVATPEDEMLEVHEALDALARQDERKAELVKLRYFVGLSVEETAAILNLSVRTVKRDWAYSRAWLFREIARHKG